MLLIKEKNFKKSGNILIETMAALFILTSVAIFASNSYIHTLSSIKKRILSEEINSVVYNLINEIKYNTSKEELMEILINDELNLKYSDEFAKNLMNKEVKDLELGNEIKIKLVSQNNLDLNFKISANVLKENNEINIEKEFNKAWWTDEI